jgi:hypothetical protein
MKVGIHTDMALQVLRDCPNKDILTFLLEGTVKIGWKEKKDNSKKEQWLKEWMDMPDNKKHSSKMSNDHSYKIEKDGKKFKIVFAGTKTEQATVVARLKYAVRDIKEWKVEEEYRVCAIALAKSLHWVIDMSSPPHTLAGWDDKLHSKAETDFDASWKSFYKPSLIKFGRKGIITDVYGWAKGNIESRYSKNELLLKLYSSGGSIKKGDGTTLGEDVIKNLAQNMADYLAYIDSKIDCSKLVGKV